MWERQKRLRHRTIFEVRCHHTDLIDHYCQMLHRRSLLSDAEALGQERVSVASQMGEPRPVMEVGSGRDQEDNREGFLYLRASVWTVMLFEAWENGHGSCMIRSSSQQFAAGMMGYRTDMVLLM
jgi:hypothetical protein